MGSKSLVISHMVFNIWNMYRKLPDFMQALVAALLAFFLNVSVAVILVFAASTFIFSDEEPSESQERSVLGIKTKKGSVVIDVVKNILYIAEDIFSKDRN